MRVGTWLYRWSRRLISLVITEISVKFIFTKIPVGYNRNPMKIILEVKSCEKYFDPKMIIFGSFCPKWSENRHFRIGKSIFTVSFWKLLRVSNLLWVTDCELLRVSFTDNENRLWKNHWFCELQPRFQFTTDLRMHIYIIYSGTRLLNPVNWIFTGF